MNKIIRNQFNLTDGNVEFVFSKNASRRNPTDRTDGGCSGRLDAPSRAGWKPAYLRDMSQHMENLLDPGYYESGELISFGFKAVGRNVRISKACNIVGLGNIEVGDNVRVDAFTSIIANNGWLKLGSYVHVGTSCLIGARGGIEFGDFTGLSHGSKLLSASDDFSGQWMMNYGVPRGFTNPNVAPIRIGHHAVIGSICVVMPGCDIGEGSVVGAGSVVTRSLDSWGIHVGTPAKRIRPRSRRVLDLEQLLRAGEPPPAAQSSA